MQRFTANIAFLFAELPLLDRIAAAKAAGFDKVECHFPYKFSIPVLKDRLDAAGVRMTGLNTPPGDRARGEFGFAGVPGQEDRFRRDFAQALDYTVALNASVIHVMAGAISTDERSRALRTYVANMRAAAREAVGTGITLLLEPLNTRDNPGYLVSRSDEIADIIAEIDEPTVKLLFDVYHVQIMEGDLISRIRRHRSIIGHVQIAGVPDRAEPDEGNEINYRAILIELERVGYAGLVGLEYKPRGRTEDGLDRVRRLTGPCI
jgi:2-dehydrotetronate isomerase